MEETLIEINERRTMSGRILLVCIVDKLSYIYLGAFPEAAELNTIPKMAASKCTEKHVHRSMNMHLCMHMTFLRLEYVLVMSYAL